MDILKKIASRIREELEEYKIEQEIQKRVVNNLSQDLAKSISYTQEKEMLEIYYHYEKVHLELLKAYKEEIKFLNDQQMEIRKEKTKFFAESLKEVANTLKEVQVDPKVSAAWIVELVRSYTNSLNLSNNLVEETTLNSINEMKTKAQKEKEKISSKQVSSQNNET